jgi:hypothetical protein
MKKVFVILSVAILAGIGGFFLKSKAPMLTIYAEVDSPKIKITYDHGESLLLGPFNRGEKRSFQIMKKEANILIESFDSSGALKARATVYYTNPFITDIYCTVRSTQIVAEAALLQ